MHLVYPIIHWTMDWINDTNVVAIEAAVSDPIPSGTRFYDDGIPVDIRCRLPIRPDQLNTGVSCTSTSQITTTTLLLLRRSLWILSVWANCMAGYVGSRFGCS